MFLTLALWFFATVTVSSLIVCSFIKDPEDRTWKHWVQAYVTIGLGLAIIPWLCAPKETTVEYKLKEQQWVANGCPMYKSECGSRNPYACEQKAPKEGRNMIGDIAIVAYKTCNPTP